MEMFNTIVVAVDFSETSRDVLHYAARVAGNMPRISLHVLHVVQDPLQQPWAVEAVGIDFDQLEQDWIADARRKLQALIAAETFAALSPTPVVRVGRSAESIVGYAAEVAADVLVMGTHGYGPIRRFMLGSVVERVLRQATCPVLTVPDRSLKAADVQSEPATAVLP